jgi:hypothetical protein
MELELREGELLSPEEVDKTINIVLLDNAAALDQPEQVNEEGRFEQRDRKMRTNGIQQRQ